MAAITPTNRGILHITGDVAFRHYNFAGASGDTLQVPMKQVFHVCTNPGSVITSYTTSLVNGGTQITFTSSGPMTAENVLVWARVV